MREVLEQTRFIRSRPMYDQEAGLQGSLEPMDPWMKIIMELVIGMLIGVGIMMAFW